MSRISEFQLQSADRPIFVEFWGPRKWQDLDGTHDGGQILQRSWIESIKNSFPDAWRALPRHEYIDFLSKQGFEYEEYLIQPSLSDITILCRTVAHIY